MHVCDVFVVWGVNVSMRACMPVVIFVLLCDCFTMMMPGNGIGPEGAKALAPSLGRLNQLNMLDLGGE